MPVTRWVFTDPTDASTYEFEWNPSEGGTPGVQKKFQYMATAGPSGQMVAFEGRDEPTKMEISGVFTSEDTLNSLTEWAQKRYPITVTDDLSRTYTIYIESFTPIRKRSALYPYKHDWTMTFTIFDW